uniref:Uncharacterized protein n=1 Tax=Trichuris muris TaxID=70415 RepID=A0A5S6QG56_TRIMR
MQSSKRTLSVHNWKNKSHKVYGYGDRRNDILCCHANGLDRFQSLVVFFPGDVQDYPETMASHPDNLQFLRWNLENVARMLIHQFSSSLLLIVKASQLAGGTFACYKNFVISNTLGVPQFSDSYGSWKHLERLTENSVQQLKLSAFRLPISLIGFSKGCVVLNQLVYETCDSSKECADFMGRIKAVCWLDGGHAGRNSTWLTDGNRIKVFAHKFSHCKFQVDVTPYQVSDFTRPWIGREQREFVDLMVAAGANLQAFKHFDTEERSIENHFRVIEQFRPSWS